MATIGIGPIVVPVAILRSVGGLIFDATFRESHDLEMELTENPIETGNEVADHAFVKPNKLTIAAGVSDSPLHYDPEDQFAGVSRSRQAYILLKQLRDTREPFDIQTGLTLYQNMMCVRIRCDQDKDTANVFFFEAEFKEVQIVSTQTVIYPPRAAGKTKRQASATKVKGEQQGKQVTDPNKQDSLAFKLYKMLSGK